MRPFAGSPSTYARLGGLAYLAVIALGLFGETAVRGTLVVPGDAAGTMAKIAASPGLWRAGVAGDVLMHVLDVPLIALLYLLLRPVGHGLALVATIANVVQTAVLVANKSTLVAALVAATDAASISGLGPAGVAAVGYLGVKLHGYGFGIGLVFFGVACLVRGYLVYRSGFLPAFLGVLLALAGACYLANSGALLLAPSFANALFPAILLPAFVGELALALWLVAKGVDEARWKAANP